MNSSPAEAKTQFRSSLREALRVITADQRLSESQAAVEKMRAEPLWKGASAILFYAARADELDLSPLINTALKEGKIAALPQSSAAGDYQAAAVMNVSGDCRPGRFGLFEPASHCPIIPLKQLDLIFVPGVGFDSSGRRLGRGKGFYDRILSQVTGLKCGVGFDLQLVSDPLPEESHDIRLDLILTPTRLIKISSRTLKDVFR